MSGKQWMWLLLFYVIYLLLGSWIFIVLEAQNDIDTKYREVTDTRHLEKLAIETLSSLRSSEDKESLYSLLMTVRDVRGTVLPHTFNFSQPNTWMRGPLNSTDEDVKATHHWDLWNTFYFSFITITTIGYGHIYPKTALGQQFCIIYSLFGIPLNTLLFVTLSTFYKDYILSEEDKKCEEKKPVHILMLRATMYMIPGLLVFLLLPSIVFMLVEDWTYLESVYFAFISLTTIGYGEYVAGHPDHHGGWDFIYKLFIMLWTVFGLSYIIMVVGFLMNALTSPQIRTARKKTTKRVGKVTKLIQQLNKWSPNQEFNSKKSEPQEGLDNKAFSISEGIENDHQVTPTASHDPPTVSGKGADKSFGRRMSVIEQMLPENQRSSVSTRRRGSASADIPNKSNENKQIRLNLKKDHNQVQTIRELLEAVQDLLDNEFTNEVNENQISEKAKTESSIEIDKVEPTESGKKITDATVHL